MVRTKSDACVKKAVAAKAPRKVAFSPGASTSSGASGSGVKSDKYAGGNSYCPRPTPTWQKEIGVFFKKASPDKESDASLPDNSSSSCNSDNQKVESMKEPSTSNHPGPAGPSGSNFSTNGIISDDED